MHGNSKYAMTLKMIDIRKTLEVIDPTSKQAEYLQAQLLRLVKRLYR
jgi:hypothetical protein